MIDVVGVVVGAIKIDRLLKRLSQHNGGAAEPVIGRFTLLVWGHGFPGYIIPGRRLR